MNASLAEAAAFGLHVDTSFLTPSDASRLTEQLLACPAFPSTVHVEELGGYVVDKSRRDADAVQLSAELIAELETRFGEVLAAVGAHFGVELTEIETIQSLRYKPGQGFQAHMDRTPPGTGTEATRARKITLLLFANGPPAFEGGDLAICVFGDRAPDFALPVQPQAGTLLAFPSQLLHEVCPVVEGTRCSVVAWAH